MTVPHGPQTLGTSAWMEPCLNSIPTPSAQSFPSPSPHPNWPLGMAAAGCASHLCLGNQRTCCQANSKEPSDKLLFFFFSHIFIFFSFLFGKALEMFLKGLFSATSFLLHHSKHCNIIKLVKRKQWCLSFSQTARCSFRGETAICMAGGG